MLALRAASCGQPLPGFGRGAADEVVDARAADGRGLGYGGDVEETVVFEETARAGVLAVSGVCLTLSGLRLDGILEEASESADPLRLMCLFGNTEQIALRYTTAARRGRIAKLPR